MGIDGYLVILASAGGAAVVEGGSGVAQASLEPQASAVANPEKADVAGGAGFGAA